MIVTDRLNDLCVALDEDRPIVLLLGQDAWKSGIRPDPILELAFKRTGRHSSNAVAINLRRLLDRQPLPEGFYDWLAETYAHQPEPSWMETISQLPLNAIFTSSIDPAISRAFRINGREVEPVLSNQDNPAAPRDRRYLHLTYLFGRAGENNPNERPPLDNLELRKRTALHATPMLSRIIETTTPLGVLLIDGLTWNQDWLSKDALLGILSAFSPGQVFWFGWDLNESRPGTGNLQELEAPHGPVTFIKDRLSPSLKQLELANRIDISSPRKFALEGSVTIGDHVLEIEPAVRLKVSTAARIVEDTWMAPLPALDSNVEYAEFRRFHGQVEDARRLFEGIRRGFAIERTFESKLHERVRRALLHVGRKREKPVLIHGQSGSGKSLALARLANVIRLDDSYPVLFASRVTRIPAVVDLDEFCLQAEDAGAKATLVICDANAVASRYNALLRGFMSRGRRVVVVGSAYRMGDDSGDDSHRADHLLEVPAELDEGETSDLAQLVRRWTGVASKAADSEYLLPAIYRMLPEVRPILAAGLAKEATAAEDALRSRGTEVSRTPPIAGGALGEALIKAGLVDPKTLLEQKIDDFLGVMSDAASKVIDLVMVPGKLACWVPLNLLMRAVGGSESRGDVAALFSDIDLFRWSTNDEDDVLVHPRLRVEADLICARRLGAAQAEAEVALRLLAHASPSMYGSCERRFVLDLVHKLGPDGPFGRRYAGRYLDIARALTEMRERRGVKDPSLMLQEATLRRATLRLRVFRDAEIPEFDPAAILEEARQIVDLALDDFGTNSSPGLRRACANLKVERAAIYGFRAVDLLNSNARSDEVWQFYLAARDSIRSVVFCCRFVLRE